MGLFIFVVFTDVFLSPFFYQVLDIIVALGKKDKL